MAMLVNCKSASKHPECINRTLTGLCKSLDNTAFIDKCPFYKTKADDDKIEARCNTCYKDSSFQAMLDKVHDKMHAINKILEIEKVKQ